MRTPDLFGLAAEALAAHRLRYGLSALAIAVGVGSVVLLSAVGEGTRLYVLQQVNTFGTTIVGVHPGRVETGGVPGRMGGGARKLTLDDARALSRLPGVVEATPLVEGSGLVEFEGRGRRVFVVGTGGNALRVWSMEVAAGQYLPDVPWDRAVPVTVLGPTLKRELYGDRNALGTIVRIGKQRFRVIGVMASKGQFLGFDLDDAAYIPVTNALTLFNQAELGEVNLRAATVEESERVAERARLLMIDRHQGREDVTIVTQKDALGLVNGIMGVLTGTVTAIAGISLVVGAIGIFTILWIVVQERIQEVGLVMALGGRRRDVLAWYLCEAALTSVAGGAAGLLGGVGLGVLLARFVPGVSVEVTPGIVLAAIAMALAVGLLAGVAPALRAAGLDPVDALRAE